MAVYGADVGQLRDLAQRMVQSADRLDNEVIVGTGNLITQSPWQGTDSSEFRQQWSRQLVPLLRRSAGNLRQCETTLLNNARQQEETSASDNGGQSGGQSSGSSSEAQAASQQPNDPLGWFLAMAGGAVSGVQNAITQTVKEFGRFAPRTFGLRSIFSGGKIRSPFVWPRFEKINPNGLFAKGLQFFKRFDVNNYISTRSPTSKAMVSGGKDILKGLKLLGRGMTAVTTTMDFLNQWNQDSAKYPNMSFGEKAVRSGVVAGTKWATGAAGAKIGMVIGAAGGPVGMVVGGVVGGIIGGLVAEGPVDGFLKGIFG